MNREIKLRAWDKNAKKWRTIASLDWYKPITGKTGLCGACVILDDGRDQFMPIEEIEIVQFTGFKDKNRKEIYEGDILDTEAGRFVVVWETHSAAFRYHDLQGNSESPLNYDHIEVIGNIYENPDLIKQ